MSIIIQGKVVSGVQEAGHFTSLEWVKLQCLEKLGFSPWPGTLNLKLEGVAEQDWQKVRQQGRRVDFRPPDESGYCPALVYPATLGEITCAVVVPLVTGYPNNVLELLAPMHLRGKLGLVDSEEVMIVFN